MTRIGDKEFRAMAAAAVERIPGDVRSKLENLVILTEDEPSPEKLAELGMEDDDTLLGLFEGLTRGEERTAGSHLPPVITLYRLPILECCETRLEVEREIADTLWHEVAHYLGLDEEDVHREEEKSDAKRGR